MTLPLLNYSISSQNNRVKGFEVAGDEHPRIYNAENLLSKGELDELIYVAYRQVFNEQQILSANREKELESQLRGAQITVRDFIKGLALSNTFRQRYYQVNNNYRFVRLCVQRFLGREVYNNQEKLAWSIVLATLGLERFINKLLNSDEYLNNFGDDIVPFQRRRILPQREKGDLSFAKMARYDESHRSMLQDMGYFSSFKEPGAEYKAYLNWPDNNNVWSSIVKFVSIFVGFYLVGVIFYFALKVF